MKGHRVGGGGCSRGGDSGGRGGGAGGCDDALTRWTHSESGGRKLHVKRF